jgi:hypothetical protein
VFNSQRVWHLKYIPFCYLIFCIRSINNGNVTDILFVFMLSLVINRYSWIYSFYIFLPSWGTCQIIKILNCFYFYNCCKIRLSFSFFSVCCCENKKSDRSRIIVQCYGSRSASKDVLTRTLINESRKQELALFCYLLLFRFFLSF